MPKKRFTSLYSKPQSTVHPSLQSPATSASSSNQNDAQPSVNDLIASLRKSTLTVQPPASSKNASRTLPPQIRHLLAEPETPAPRPRTRRRRDANGRLIPPGPTAPQSWLEGLQNKSAEERTQLQHLYPTDVSHLPGLNDLKGDGMSLQAMCLRSIAQNWEEMQEYEQHNLVYLPTNLRSLLLSYIAVYGPEDGIGYQGLRNLIIPPRLVSDDGSSDGHSTFNPAEKNEGFVRLDLSGAMGKSVFFKQLAELVEKPEVPPVSEDELSWEETLTLGQSLSAPIPILTHLSLAHPARSISWPRLLSFSKLVPTLTHLSLAFWPVPSLTPNAKTTVMQGAIGREIQYGGTNYYSHSLDDDFEEAAEILRRLALRLYRLEYIDLSGCTDWLRALQWSVDAGRERGLDWSTQWTKLSTLKVLSGFELDAHSNYGAVARFVRSYKEAVATEDMLRWCIRRSKAQGRRANWIDVIKDDWAAYGELWVGGAVPPWNMDDVKRKRKLLDSLKNKRTSQQGEEQWRSTVSFDLHDEPGEGAVERLSVWEQ